ncbi:MAG: hypothetical protein GY811_08140 [Myxococcales bacterium]|nr:hypothetical protein [Myxococcales bacterium]
MTFTPHGEATAQPRDDEDEEVFEPDQDDEEVFEPDGEEEASTNISALSLGKKAPPPGFENFEVVDRTIGFRDDTFAGISVDGNRVLWVTTYEGRIYRSNDAGDNWSEFAVLPEMKELWGFASQRVLLGHLRNSDARHPRPISMSPSGGIGTDSRSYSLLGGNAAGATTMGGASGYSLDGTPSLTLSGGFSNPLKSASRAATGESSVVLGAGLSVRAPRLGVLLTILKRPIANISMQRLLDTTASRWTTVREVTPHPTDPTKVFAATAFGLYKSGDEGQSWYRDFAGMTPAERWIGHVSPDPKKPQRVYLGTSRGLFQSDNGGEGWSKNTKVPELSIRRVIIDPTDSRYVYAAGLGGVYRSDDFGENFSFAYYHSIPRRRDVLWMVIDPFDPNIAYLGTSDGLMRTNNLRTSTIGDWEVVRGNRTSNLAIPEAAMCSRHPGHLYIITRADLPTINFFANGPESLLLESWDHGESWRELAGNRTGGDIQWFALDPKDPDTVWVAFSRAIAQIRRVAEEGETDISKMRFSMGRPVLPELPDMGRVLRAGLLYSELEMGGFVERLDSLRERNWLPSHINITGGYDYWNVGSAVQDIQFPGDKTVAVQSHGAWNVTAWLSWTLPDLLYRQDSAPLMRIRELKMVNVARERIMRTIHRNYGELQRIRVLQRHEKDKSLMTRVNWALRADYLEAIVNMTTGDYLRTWNEKVKKQ